MKLLKQFISVLLVAAFIIGMMPQITLTSRAAEVEGEATETETAAPTEIPETAAATEATEATEALEIEAPAITREETPARAAVAYVSIGGQIVDAEGNPLSGVSVALFNLDEETSLTPCVTGSDGSWVTAEYEVLAGYTYLVSYYRAGYGFSANNTECIALDGGLTLETVTATPLNSSGLVCNEADYEYTVDESAETASITGYTGSDTAIQLPETLGGYPVTSIGASVFEENYTLETVVFSGGITSIGSNAFYNCDELTQVYLPNVLTTIGSRAFYDCDGLVSVELPDSVTTLGGSVFAYSSSLSSINYPRGLTDGGKDLASCTSLVSVTVPEGVTTLADLFYGANYLEEVILPGSLKTIGSFAFSGCTRLKSIDLPEGLTTIEWYAFENCKALTSVEFPESVTTIGKYAFSGCTSLSQINYPVGVASVSTGSYIFSGCTSLKKVEIPEGVAAIASCIFEGAGSLEEVIIPNTVTTIGGSAFSECTSLKSIDLPDHLTAIGNSLFYGCTALQSVEIPAGVTSIGSYAFSKCTSLTSVSIPEGVTTIGNSAFEGCTALKGIVLPDGVTSLGSAVFKGCTSLSSVNYPAGLTTAYSNIFANCSSLTSITVPEGVTAIADYAFYGANYLKYVFLPETLTSVGSYAFYGCTAMSRMVLPDSVTAISSYAFANCTGLQEIWIGENVTSIGSNAFRSCSGVIIHGVAGTAAETCATSYGFTFSTEPLSYDLADLSGQVTDAEGNGIAGVSVSIFDITRGESLCTGLLTDENGQWSADEASGSSTYIVSYYKAGYTFSANDLLWTAGEELETVEAEPITGLVCNEADYAYSVSGGAATITGYTGTDTAIQIPDELEGYPVTEISSKAFQNNTELQTVALPTGVTTIGTYAFDGCTALNTVYLPNTLTAVKNYAFRNCAALDGIVLPDSLSTIGTGTFSGCASLSSINYPRGLSYGSSGVFADCTSLTVVEIPADVTALAAYAFAGAPALKAVTLPENLISVGQRAFSGCTALETLELPDSVTTIGNAAFEGCTSLVQINYPASLSSMGSSVFQNCSGLTSFEIPEGVTTVLDNFFCNANYMEEIILPDSITAIGEYAFSGCTSLKSIDIPAGVTAIGSGAFSSCEALISLALPEGVTTIDSSAFSYCTSLSSINYPLSLTSVGSGAFANCTSLTSITVPEGVTAIPAYAFDGANCLKEIILPDTLTSIGKYAFRKCTALTSIELPDSLTELPSYLFYQSTALKDVKLPENLTLIDSSAFYGCTALETIDLPESLTTLNYGAFRNCTSLRSFTYPVNLTTAGGEIFRGCTSLTAVTVPEGVTEIVKGMFQYADSLKYVFLPESLEIIGEQAFENCYALEKFVVPGNVTTIGRYAFGYDTALTDIWIGETVTSIDSSAFYKSTNVTIHGAAGSYAEEFAAAQGIAFSTDPVEISLTGLGGRITDADGNGLAGVSILICNVSDKTCVYAVTDEDGRWQVEDCDESLTYLVSFYKAGYSFSINDVRWTAEREISLETVTAQPLEIDGLTCNEADFDYSISGSAATVTGYTGSDAAIQIPETLGGYPVTAIGYQAFMNNTVLETVVLPGSVAELDDHAFSGCTGLQAVYLPNTLTTIGISAFRGCTALESVDLPDSVSAIKNSAFYECAALSEINYPLCWSSAGGSIFSGCTRLTSITVPEGVTAIPDYAFGKASLEEVILPDSLLSIGTESFARCTALTSIDLPQGLTSIGQYAFFGCTGLESVTLPDSVASIDSYAFANCTNLGSINYPLSWAAAGAGIFLGCTSLTAITVPEGVATIPYNAFRDAEGLKEVTLPESLTYISGYAFSGCTALKEIVIPENVERIGDYAFSGCTALRTVTLPDGLTTLGTYAFQNCARLSSINYPAGLASAASGIFAGCTSLASITVPEGVTTIPYNAFKDADCLKYVSLPESLEKVDSQAFHNCDTLRMIVLPASVSSIGSGAFANCALLGSVTISNGDCAIGSNVLNNSPNAEICAPCHSAAICYAIENSIPFTEIGSAADLDDTVLDRENSSFYVDTQSVTINGYINVKISYSIQEGLSETLTDSSIYIMLPENARFLEGTLKLNDAACTDYSTSGARGISVPVTAASGTLQFSMTATGQGTLYAYTALDSTADGVTRREVIGTLQEGVNVLTLNAPDVTADSTVSIDGAAPASAAVDIYVDGIRQQTVYASRAGNWSAVASINDAVDYASYTIQVVCAGEPSNMTRSATVMYHADEAVLTDFTMHTSGDSRRQNLLSSDGIVNTVFFMPGERFIFEITFDHPEQIDTVYVESTRSNSIKTLEATYDESTGMFVAEGLFDPDDPNYVPGKISLSYTKVQRPVTVSESFDWSAFDDYMALASEDTVTYDTATDTKIEAQIDLGTIDDSLEGLIMDARMSVYDPDTDGDLSSWMGQSLSNSTWQKLMDADGNLFRIIYTCSGETVSFVIETTGAEDYVKFDLFVSDQAGFWGTVLDASETFSNVNTGAGLILNMYQINADMDELREEVATIPYETESDRKEALEAVDQLESDQYMYTLTAMVLPMLVATGPMAMPAIVFSGLLLFMSYKASSFWDFRAARIKSGEFKAKVVIDPSGYVYDSETGELLEGVKTTAYYIPNDDSEDFWDNPPADTEYGTVWNAAEYDQQNPLYTDEAGRYAWDVPEGWWRVKYEKEGYETTWSDWLPVPPPQTEVNIGMTALPFDGTASGTCGSKLTWSLADGVLTISGTGAMTDYTYGSAPWHTYADSITTVTIGSGITSVGTLAFYGVTATVNYPARWSGDMLLDYGGTITWVCYGVAIEAPALKAVNVTSTGKIKLSWNAVEGAAKYIITIYDADGNEIKTASATGTTLSHSSADAGVTYSYTVVAVAEDGSQSENSNLVTITCKLARPAVTLSNVDSTGKIKISWDAVRDATKYTIYIYDVSGNLLKSTSTTKTSVTHSTATAGETYTYRVRAVCSVDDAASAWSASKSLTCDLAQPVISVANVASTGKNKISWEAVKGATKYTLYIYDADGELLKTASTTKTSATHSTAVAGETYIYKVRALCDISAATSAYSAGKSRCCDLARPTITVTNVVSTGKNKISWAAVKGATKYTLYIYDSDGKLLKTASTTKTSATHSTAVAGETYTYKVRALCGISAATSAYSGGKSRCCDLARPTVSVSRNSSGKPVVSWGKVTGAAKYKVYIYDASGNPLKTVTTTGTKLTHGSAVAGTTYKYRVVAIHSNTSANSAYSATVSIKSR